MKDLLNTIEKMNMEEATEVYKKALSRLDWLSGYNYAKDVHEGKREPFNVSDESEDFVMGIHDFNSDQS